MGGVNQVKYQKELLRSALAYERQDFQFDYFVIMTGQDYPLMSNRDLQHYYSNPRHPMIVAENLTRDCHDRKYMERITVYHFLRDIRVRNRRLKQAFSFGARTLMRLLPFRKPPYLYVDGKRWDVYYSSSYMALDHETAEVAYHHLCNNKPLMRYFNTSYVPEELVIPSIICNTELRKQALVLSDWKQGLIRVSNLEQFDYGKFIKVYTEDDYEELINCSKPFARKLETGKSDKLMDMLDKHNGICKP